MDLLLHLKILTMLSHTQAKEYISNMKNEELQQLLAFIREIESITWIVDKEYDLRVYKE